MKLKTKQINNSILLTIILAGCDLLNQNDYVETIEIGLIDKETIFCDVYQTGIDNYRYEFQKIAEGSDTMTIFPAYLNDAMNGNEDFELNRIGDTIEITTTKPIIHNPINIDNKTYLLKMKR